MSNEDLHKRIVAFLSGEFVRVNQQQCVKVELEQTPLRARGEEIRSWTREEDPELFADLTRVEKFTSDVIARSEQCADSYGQPQRFTLRTIQYLGGRATFKFTVAPRARDDIGEEDGFEDLGGNALALPGGGGMTVPGGASAQVLGMMSTVMNRQMAQNERYHLDQRQSFAGTLNVFKDMINDLRAENAQLRKERADHLARLEDKEAADDQRTMDLLIQQNKDKRKDQIMEKIMPMLPIVLAKFMSKNGVGPTPVSILASELGKTISDQQKAALFTILQPGQLALLGNLLAEAQKMEPIDDKQAEEKKKAAAQQQGLQEQPQA